MKWTYPGQTPEQRERQRATLADMEQRRQHFARHGLRPVGRRLRGIEIIYEGSDGWGSSC